jgi:hypothetical protein
MADSMKPKPTGVWGRVTHSQNSGPVKDAELELLGPEYGTAGQTGETTGPAAAAGQSSAQPPKVLSGPDGRFQFDPPSQDGLYCVRCQAFGLKQEKRVQVTNSTAVEEVLIDLPLDLTTSPLAYLESETLAPATRVVADRPIVLRAGWRSDAQVGDIEWNAPQASNLQKIAMNEAELVFHATGRAEVCMLASELNQNSFSKLAQAATDTRFAVSPPQPQTMRGSIDVQLRRAASEPTLDQALWVTIRNRTHAISFGRYREFINRVLRWEENERFPEPIERRLKDLGTHLHGVGAYQVLKTATEVFLLLECGVRIEVSPRAERRFDCEESARLEAPVTPEQIAHRLKEYLGHRDQLPYITRVVEAAYPELERATLSQSSHRDHILVSRINEPCLIELIWSYWLEEGMLVQTINAISQRFQNVRRPGVRNPLANLEVDPLRPVNNLLWGYIQDEPNRLSVSRRAYEYLHEYGLCLYGKATHGMYAADLRSKFLEAFHNLLYQSSVFFKEDFQTTVIADGYPLLNSLKEVHLVLAQGAHNQFGDLPWTARTEMLLAEYMLSRPEMREFLQSRVMVPYKEAWMPQVDAMKTLQAWSDVTITHFRDLAVYGEQLLLSVRYGDWIGINDEDSAKNWARYWRPEIQGYLHAYRAATGIDLTNPDTVDSTIPAILLQKRLAAQTARSR